MPVALALSLHQHSALYMGTSVEPKAADVSQQSLTAAFASFSEVAGTLEKSYRELQADVKRLRLELAAKNRELAHSQQERRQAQALAKTGAVLAHEVRNPLASLELFAGLLAGTVATGSQAASWATHLQAGLRSLTATVNNVLVFKTGSTPNLVPTEIGPLLLETIQFLEPLARQHGVRLQLEPGEEATVAADGNALRQVFLNLALNAFRAAGAGTCDRRAETEWSHGKLVIRARVERTQMEVSFEDDGPGVPASDRQRIFEPGVSTRGGAGLGLAVSKRIIEQHGGHISAGASPYGGARIVICLPRSERQP